MKKLNNKGFTLVEVLAVVVILSILTAIMIPSVNYLITMNKENNYESLENGIIQATKVLFSDYRYDVSIQGSCNNPEDELDILMVGNYSLAEEGKLGASKVPIEYLVTENNILVNESGKVINPNNKEQNLDLAKSYVLVKYQCSTKDFSYEIGELIWK